VVTPLRHRYRAQVRDAIKQAGLGQLAAGGPQALSLNAIAKELGVSGPALYRYFAGRDELLTELIVDAYDDLGAAVGVAAARVEVLDDPRDEAPSAALARELERWARTRDIDVSAPVALRAVQVWARLHGFVSLEIGGNFAAMGLDPDKLFRAELERL
jgi:AcrR family transcriptional regulator